MMTVTQRINIQYTYTSLSSAVFFFTALYSRAIYLSVCEYIRVILFMCIYSCVERTTQTPDG